MSRARNLRCDCATAPADSGIHAVFGACRAVNRSCRSRRWMRIARRVTRPDGPTRSRRGFAHPLRRQRRTTSVLWLAIAGTITVGGAITLALLTSQNSRDEPVQVGTITLGLTPTSALIALPAMVPGDSVSGVLTVQNTGTGAFRYAMTGSATDPDAKHLATALTLTIERRTGCSGPVLETLYNGSLASAAFGNPAAGSDVGDRALGPGTSEALCFRVTLPTGTDPAFAAASTSWTLTMWAEQTANNP